MSDLKERMVDTMERTARVYWNGEDSADEEGEGDSYVRESYYQMLENIEKMGVVFSQALPCTGEAAT